MTSVDGHMRPPAPPLRAEPDGRRLRLELPGRAFVVDPLPAKCGLALSTAIAAQAAGRPGGMPRESVLAEALGPQNYALITGDHVQEFDESGRYLRTSMAGAVMIEPLEDVPPPAPGQRTRVVASEWDGLDLRVEEVEALALAAFYWQSVAGWKGLTALLNGVAGSTGETAAFEVLLDGLRRHGLPADDPFRAPLALQSDR